MRCRFAMDCLTLPTIVVAEVNIQGNVTSLNGVADKVTSWTDSRSFGRPLAE